MTQVTATAGLGGNLGWVTSDGKEFTDKRRADLHQRALDGQLTRPMPLPSISAAATIHWLHGEGFTVGDVPVGDAHLGYDRTSNRVAWRLHDESLRDLTALPYALRKAKIDELRRAREGGDVEMKGVVQPNHRGVTTPQRPSDLTPLLDRCRSLVVTIANLDTPTDGQVGEIAKTVAALQAARDAAAEQLAEIDSNLALGRAVIRAHSDPRVARP